MSMEFGPASPYRSTKVVGRFAGYYVHRSVDPHQDDAIVKVSTRWHQRPDLMSYDLYGNPDLFVVIAVRNKLQDPIYDLVEGIDVVVPSADRARQLTGTA